MGKKSSSKLKHKRLDSVLLLLVEKMVNKYVVLLRRLSDNRSEEVRFNRFVNNKSVTPQRIVAQHWTHSEATFEGKHLLVLNDTTTAAFSAQKNREYLGYLSHNSTKEAFDVHPSIIVDAQDGACYGLGGITTYRNLKFKPDDNGKSKEQKKSKRSSAYSPKPFQEKERYKWFASPQQAINNCTGAARYTLVGDRESDIYELIWMTLNAQWDFLYRCAKDRKVTGAAQKLYATLDTWAVKHQYQIALQATKKRGARLAELDVKFGQVSIQQPKNHPNKSLPATIKIGVIEVRETPQTVLNGQKPIHWVLLTSHPVEELENVLQIINWYRWRWIIEQLFRTTKSKGLDIEHAELKSFHGLANLATLALLASVQVMQLIQARDGLTKQRLEDAFDAKEQKCLKAILPKLEGKTEKQKNPHNPKSLAFGTWIIARLGGWKGYRSERPPGPLTMMNGLIRFHYIKEGFNLIF